MDSVDRIWLAPDSSAALEAASTTTGGDVKIAKIRQVNSEKGRRYEVPNGDGTTSLYPSVTTILGCIGKPALISWSARVERDHVVAAAVGLHQDWIRGGAGPMSAEAYQLSLQKRLGAEKAHSKELEKAASIGSAVHHWIEWELHRELGVKVPDPAPLPPEGVSCFAAYHRWREQVEMKPILVEQTVYSMTGGYAGTMDLLCELTIDGVRDLCVVDWKSSSGVYPEMHLQVAAYATALREMGHTDGVQPHGMIVRLPKTKMEKPEPEPVLVHRDRHAELMRVFGNVRALWAWQNGDE
jgi:hypothetical protein